MALSFRRLNRISYRRLAALCPLQYNNIQVKLTESPGEKPKDTSRVVFGSVFTDHMLEIDWTVEKGWESPLISPYHDFPMSPATSALHYGIECFEGMKAYRGVDGKVRLFRPMENMQRMFNSGQRLCLPAFDKEEFLKCIKRLVHIDADWVPKEPDCSLYIRPTFIGYQPSLGVGPSKRALLYCILSPVGPYFKDGGFKPVSLLADPRYVRSWPGGMGDCKAGGNYGATVLTQVEAERRGCQQVLWLYGDDYKLTEVGTMNMFIYMKNEQGVNELVTPPLDGLILPGVTRKSIVELAQKWENIQVSERSITMQEVVKALEEGRLMEMFGAGTACVVCPVDRILYNEKNYHIPTMDNGAPIAKRAHKELTSIQWGETPHEWSVPVSD
ncbi:branched-chain-amino-acid aminotransferase-like [Oscarella lobularis]|uniref:branched-chain-amino-acid aminotransferase-like n=1 Tax=Oscarella lobularis TaxID=121494 RepID=UPI003313A44D